jgi:hypothetical protein
MAGIAHTAQNVTVSAGSIPERLFKTGVNARASVIPIATPSAAVRNPASYRARHVAAQCAQRHARDRVRHHAGDSNRRDQQRQRGKRAQNHRPLAPDLERFRHSAFQRFNIEQRLTAVDALHDASHRGRQAGRLPTILNVAIGGKLVLAAYRTPGKRSTLASKWLDNPPAGPDRMRPPRRPAASFSPDCPSSRDAMAAGASPNRSGEDGAQSSEQHDAPVDGNALRE